ncbi:carboxymuconolactone decarboxylase family protein [Arthrobacter sp. HY1533]|uniref:carboxymuconolactone decarboxylase family protein n=1 Tax=Arthrobacter sp. HY1533 TaxID=2970919 RepID=UPI0022BA0247|nr:carboxymuconolactone decarboxylase family protein [Arthrobacter sp. HY1533]
MSIVDTVPVGAADGLMESLYADDARALGYVPSHTLVLALNPGAYAAWRALQQAIAASLGLRRYELVTLAAARSLGSEACLLAHGKKALAVMDRTELLRLLSGPGYPGLSPAEQAMMVYAARLCQDSAAMDDADSRTLRDAGFSDTEIVDITLAAAARNYFSRALHALAVEPDVPPELDDELREALLAWPATG